MTDEFRYSLAAMLPFQDANACARVRAIPRERVTEHSNPDFRLRTLDSRAELYRAFADDIVEGIASAAAEGRSHVMILPVGPVPQYRLAAARINAERLSLSHVVTFNMDEYSNAAGETPPTTWVGSFRRAMFDNFFNLIDPELRPALENIHFPDNTNIDRYSDLIAEHGGADVCYGGVGWSGHIAFWEPQLGAEFGDDHDAYRAAGARHVELHPITILQNALHTFGGDWSWVPPFAHTVGPRDFLGARRRSIWLDGDLGGGISWQRFIMRLVCHGPISTAVPGSFLQETRTDLTMLSAIADDVKISMS